VKHSVGVATRSGELFKLHTTMQQIGLDVRNKIFSISI
jgi:hypothetical protein